MTRDLAMDVMDRELGKGMPTAPGAPCLHAALRGTDSGQSRDAGLSAATGSTAAGVSRARTLHGICLTAAWGGAGPGNPGAVNGALILASRRQRPAGGVPPAGALPQTRPRRLVRSRCDGRPCRHRNPRHRPLGGSACTGFEPGRAAFRQTEPSRVMGAACGVTDERTDDTEQNRGAPGAPRAPCPVADSTAGEGPGNRLVHGPGPLSAAPAARRWQQAYPGGCLRMRHRT